MTSPVAGGRSRRELILRWGLTICFFTLLFVVWRVWTHEQRVVQVTSKWSVGGKEMPHQQGSVQFVGTLYLTGRVAADKKFVFLFDNDFVSQPISTRPQGTFEYTLPPGRWKLRGVLVPGYSGDVGIAFQPPVRQRDVSFDVSDGAVNQIYTLVIHAK